MTAVKNRRNVFNVFVPFLCILGVGAASQSDVVIRATQFISALFRGSSDGLISTLRRRAAAGKYLLSGTASMNLERMACRALPAPCGKCFPRASGHPLSATRDGITVIASQLCLTPVDSKKEQAKVSTGGGRLTFACSPFLFAYVARDIELPLLSCLSSSASAQ